MRRPLAISVAILVFLLPGILAVAGPEEAAWDDTPAGPFQHWDVSVVADPHDPQVVELSFDSPLLERRVISHVYLPEQYFTRGKPLPVAYFLHGTIRVHTEGNDAIDAAADAGVEGGYPLFPGGDGRTPTAFVRNSLDRADYVIITPDSGPEPWCPSCFFVDGYEGEGVAAESHLYEELLPLAEAVFRIRQDRAGRAIFGRSMGGGAALIQGFRHPDMFAFVGALSPSHIDWVRDPFGAALWKFYLQGQGYPAPQEDEISWRGINPADLATNAVGTNQEIIVVMGDGCVDHDEGLCEGSGPADGLNSYVLGAGQEIPLRRNADQFIPGLLQRGVPITYVQREGLHGELNRSSYEEYLLPALNRSFAEGTPAPDRFSYMTIERTFSVWGYDIEVVRGNREFVHVLGARLDGSEMLLGGTGNVTVTTPSGFKPGRTYEADVTPISPIPPLGRDPSNVLVTADRDGRVRFTVELGPDRIVDERSESVHTGAHAIPQVMVRVHDR